MQHYLSTLNLLGADFRDLETPAYVCDLQALRRNLERLNEVQQGADCKVLLALKGFAMWSTFPLVGEYLAGVAASSSDEAQLGREKFGKEVHTYSPAFCESSLQQCVRYSDHIILNSFEQWRRFRHLLTGVEVGMRLNPAHSEVDVALYDPCAPNSRLGVTRQAFDDDALDGISGLHWHNLCELGVDALQRTLEAVERQFAGSLKKMRWVNFGGGHHITRDDYDRSRLISLIRQFKERYDVDVYLEPGEAIALNTGVLVSSVLDIVDNGMKVALLDTSAAAHMPDVLEMPYRPEVVGASPPDERKFTYRLAGTTCLAGDVIGDYSFDKPLAIGDKLIFLDMAHYTMVKNTTFNGVRLPSIVTWEPGSGFDIVRRFGYSDYRDRLS
jgi:carboxynorspermidine decarboxylase